MDIVASNPIGIFDSEIFSHIVDLQPEVKHFFHFIRKWVCDLNDVRMKNMIVFYLTIFYLQRVRVLPTIEQVHKGVKKEMVKGEFLNFKNKLIYKIVILGWEVQFDTRRTIVNYKLNQMAQYECYLIGFFQFYGSVSFADSVIDMYSGMI